MSDEGLTVAVVGASGFVGQAVTQALSDLAGVRVRPVRAPRLNASSPYNPAFADATDRLAQALSGCGAVVNAAGIGDALSGDADALLGANSVLPGMLARVTARSGARLVHVSSAAVQGRAPLLDASAGTDEFSPYARSKAEGERTVQAGGDRFVIYRPPGVHASSRGVTRTIARVARSHASSVAAPGDQPSAQALAPNVGAAIAYLATCAPEPPPIVIHPSEGVTVSSLLEDLGGRTPKQIPQPVARMALRAAGLAGHASAKIAGNTRRLEMMWFGQRQDVSWLTEQGWRPPVGREGWRQIGADLAAETNEKQGHS